MELLYCFMIQLKRLHGIDVGVEELSYDQLRDLLNGKQQVCTLQEALSLADDYDCWVDIEIKTTQWHVVRETVSKFSPKKKIISSFRHDVLVIGQSWTTDGTYSPTSISTFQRH